MRYTPLFRLKWLYYYTMLASYITMLQLLHLTTLHRRHTWEPTLPQAVTQRLQRTIYSKKIIFICILRTVLKSWEIHYVWRLSLRVIFILMNISKVLSSCRALSPLGFRSLGRLKNLYSRLGSSWLVRFSRTVFFYT